jgi:mono/diheme cytochrome c family protein
VLEILCRDENERKRPTRALPRHMFAGRKHVGNNPAEEILVALNEESALLVCQSTVRKTRIDGVMGDEPPSDELAADIEAIDDRPVVVLKITGSGFDRERSQHVLAFANNVLSRQYAPNARIFKPPDLCWSSRPEFDSRLQPRSLGVYVVLEIGDAMLDLHTIGYEQAASGEIEAREGLLMFNTMARWCVAVGLATVAAAMPSPSAAAGPTLVVSANGVTQTFDRDALLARSDVAEISTTRDVAYGTRRSYRAVPLANLMKGIDIPADAVVEAMAKDGYVSQLPRSLVEGSDPEAVGYVAIEPAGEPWPPMPGKDASAGPFYVVWIGAQAATVPPGNWPYHVVTLSVQDPPTKRWPALVVDPMLPALDPARRGQALFVSKCLNCHTLNHAGLATMGPDMNGPMNPTEYLTDTGLRALIRDPQSVRAWPELAMPSFSRDDLSDEDITLIIAYLRHMAGRKGR